MRCYLCRTPFAFYAAQIDAWICRDCLWRHASDRVQTEMRCAELYEAYARLMRHVLGVNRLSVN